MAENNYTEVENKYTHRIPPHDEEAEQAVLGCMLCDGDGVRAAVEKLGGDDFYAPANREIFIAIIELYNSGKPIDYITLKNRLTEKDALEKAGGQQYIIHLANLVSTSVQAGVYVNIVADNSMRRRLIQAGGEISEAGFGSVESVDEVIALANQRIFDITQQRKNEDFIHINEVLSNVLDNIEKANRSTGVITGIKTGFTEFDMKTSGLHDSDLILVAARPSMGKTAFALNIAQYAAVYGKVTTAIFSLEMSSEQLGHRLLCSISKVDSQKVRTGKLSTQDWQNLIEGMGIMSEAPIYIDDTAGITPTQLLAKCRKLKMEHDLGLIVIDYLQLMNGGTGRRGDSAQQEVAFISKSLKAVAREINVPVIALSQLSRGPDSRTDHRPVLSDLRDSGAIEQDADIVCFLYRDEYYTKERCEIPGQAEVIIAKHRNGPTGSINLRWLGQFTQFANLESPDSGIDIPLDMAEGDGGYEDDDSPFA
ncbi:MAG: replicative DNA helicase [Firmicutes bacterium]|nr:replicative DNA helicase [Bacillota bacterium]